MRFEQGSARSRFSPSKPNSGASTNSRSSRSNEIDRRYGHHAWLDPSLSAPTFSKSNLGSTSEDVEASIALGKPFVALLFQQDGICPADRLTKIAELFGGDSTLGVGGSLERRRAGPDRRQ
jgi:hypothetical protein